MLIFSSIYFRIADQDPDQEIATVIAIETEIGTVIEIEIAIVVIELQKGIYDSR